MILYNVKTSVISFNLAFWIKRKCVIGEILKRLLKVMILMLLASLHIMKPSYIKQIRRYSRLYLLFIFHWNPIGLQHTRNLDAYTFFHACKQILLVFDQIKYENAKKNKTHIWFSIANGCVSRGKTMFQKC